MPRNPSKQKFFDITVAALLAMKEPALRSEDSTACVYRRVKDDGTILKCAIGYHIPDKLYKPGMEERGVNGLMNGFPQLRHLLPAGDNGLALATALQNTHDAALLHWHPTKAGHAGLNDAGKLALIRVAAQFKLDHMAVLK